MINNLEYYKHKIYDPPYYHRQYEKDLPLDDQGNSVVETAKRATLIVLPFLSLYQPLGSLISLSTGSMRVISSTSEMIQGDLIKVAQVALAILALLGTLYHFSIGLYISTAADIIANLAQIIEALSQEDYKRAAEELLQVLSSGLYLAIMMTGSLEVVLASILIQGLVSFYQAREEYAKGRLPEAIAKTLMGMVRLVQAGQQMKVIERKNLLIRRYDELAKAILKGRKIDHLYDNPILRKESTLIDDGKGNVYDFGAHLHGQGKQLVKGMNVTVRDLGEKTTLEFKVNHVFRDRLQNSIDKMKNSFQYEIQELMQLLGSHASHLTLSEKEFVVGKYMRESKAYEVDIGGLGKITIGGDPECLTLYDKVSIEMEKGKSLYDFHEALSFLNLDDALRQSADEDIERLKLGYLFRTFKPREATPFERTDACFDLSLEDYRNKILSISPEMKSIFEEYLPRMELREIVPGRMRYAIKGLADELIDKGVLGLTAGLMGAWEPEEIYDRVGSILSMGMISSEMRNDNKIGKPGLSSGADYFTGGADSIFTQIVTDSNKSYSDFAYSSNVRFLISPQALENSSYQHHYDAYGTRKMSTDWWLGSLYLNRDNIFEFLAKERMYFNWGSEVMLKERLAPEMITGIVVKNETMKTGLLNYLRERSIVQIDSAGQETIFSKPIDQFISVGNQIRKEQFA